MNKKIKKPEPEREILTNFLSDVIGTIEDKKEIYGNRGAGMSYSGLLMKKSIKIKYLKKDIFCPNCKALIKFKIIKGSENCEITAIKYQMKCGECGFIFETKWRKF